MSSKSPVQAETECIFGNVFLCLLTARQLVEVFRLFTMFGIRSEAFVLLKAETAISLP